VTGSSWLNQVKRWFGLLTGRLTGYSHGAQGKAGQVPWGICHRWVGAGNMISVGSFT
jgi:hypothetical protein